MIVLMYISDYIVPLMVLGVITYALLKKMPTFDSFTEGAKDGFDTVLSIMPTIIGLMVAVGVLRASGFLDLLSAAIEPVTNMTGFPAAAVPLTIMRLISSSASTGLLLDIFAQFGPDSFIGRFVSVMMSCTETVFYTMSIYFLSVKVTKTRYTLPGALIANFAGVLASYYITLVMFGK